MLGICKVLRFNSMTQVNQVAESTDNLAQPTINKISSHQAKQVTKGQSIQFGWSAKITFETTLHGEH